MPEPELDRDDAVSTLWPTSEASTVTDLTSAATALGELCHYLDHATRVIPLDAPPDVDDVVIPLMQAATWLPSVLTQMASKVLAFGSDPRTADRHFPDDRARARQAANAAAGRLVRAFRAASDLHRDLQEVHAKLTNLAFTTDGGER